LHLVVGIALLAAWLFFLADAGTLLGIDTGADLGAGRGRRSQALILPLI
jgi:hypothetical protein